jgi:cation-transporting ATPase 13A1
VGGETDPLSDEEEEKNEELKALLESKRRKNGLPVKKPSKTSHHAFKPIAYLDTTESGVLYWRSYDDGSKVEDFAAREIPRLSQEYDLATTGKCLAQAYENDAQTTEVLEHIKVFARMTPDAKETVIESLHSAGLLCLMCGDGANDVGALKQADVGVALLSGFGNVNVAKDEDKESKKDESKDVRAIMSQEHLNQIRSMPVMLIKQKIRQLGVDPNKYPDLVEKEDLVKLYQIKAREVAVKRHDQKNALAKKKMTKDELAAERRAEMMEKQRRMQERTAELEAQGVPWAQFKAMREVISEEMQEAKKKKGEMARARGIEGSAATLASQLEDLETTDIPMVKLGDASIAAPFTSKMPSIKSCVDIVRQGRCTLVSSMQMYQIMALQCLISSYSLSVLYLDGVKYGDTQMTAMGVLGSISFMSVSRSKPLNRLSRVQPLSSIFHPASFISLLGQFAIHLTTMVLAVQTAKKHLPEDFEIDLDGKFKPGILNTVVFLVSSVQQVTVFFVNLQGRPFMTGVTENRPLLWSLVSTFLLTFMFASETVPGLNRYFQLVPFPNEAYRDFVLTLLVIDLVATFLFDRLMKFFFARDILAASVKGTTFKDVVSLGRTFVVIGFLMYQFLGNSEQWDELIAMEQAAMNETLSTDLLDNATECVEGVCEAVNETVASLPGHDEF